MQDCMIRRDRGGQKLKEMPDDDEVASGARGWLAGALLPSSPEEIGYTRLHILVGGTTENVLRRALLPHAT